MKNIEQVYLFKWGYITCSYNDATPSKNDRQSNKNFSAGTGNLSLSCLPEVQETFKII